MVDPVIDRFRTLVNYGTLSHVRAATPDVAAKIEAIWQENGAPTALISLEGLTNPFVDTHYPQPRDILTKVNVIADLLRPLDISMRFMVTVRDQKKLLPSLFSQIFLQGFSSGLFKPTYESFIDFLLEDEILGYGPDFRYDCYLDHLSDTFGADAVFAADMKGLLSDNTPRDIAAMAAFMGLAPDQAAHLIKSGGKRNVRDTGEKGRKMVVKSPGVSRFEENTGLSLRKSAFGNTALLRKKPVYWQLPDQSARIEAYYEASNTRLADRYGITL